MSPLFGHKDDDSEAADDPSALAAEIDRQGIQALEHAGLIRTQMHTAMNSFDFALTRSGMAALQSGDVERVLSGVSG